MAEEFKESDPLKLKRPDPEKGEETECEEKSSETSSGTSGKSEESSESTSRVTHSGDESLQTSGAQPVSKECEAAQSCAEQPVPYEPVSFAKWDSPEKTQATAIESAIPAGNEQEESPNKQERPATGATGSIKEKIKLFVNMSNIFKGSKSRREDRVELLEPEVELSPRDPGEGTSRQVSTRASPEPARAIKFAEFTGQTEAFLGGQLTASKESLDRISTDTTSLTGSVSFADGKVSPLVPDPGSFASSREGSPEEALNLEKEFAELASPSESTEQGQISSKNEEEEGATGSNSSPGKCPVLHDPDRKVRKSSDRETD